MRVWVPSSFLMRTLLCYMVWYLYSTCSRTKMSVIEAPSYQSCSDELLMRRWRCIVQQEVFLEIGGVPASVCVTSAVRSLDSKKFHVHIMSARLSLSFSDERRLSRCSLLVLQLNTQQYLLTTIKRLPQNPNICRYDI